MSTRTQATRKLDNKRERFEEAGKFPTKTVVVIAAVLVMALAAGFVVYQQFVKTPEVAGIPVASAVTYPGGQAQMVPAGSVEQTTDGVSFALADVQTNYIVGLNYARQAPLPAALQEATGGNNLALLAYTAPSGKLVVATALCEPCRSTVFHIEGNSLVCNTCYTKWDLETLSGIEGGCLAYPPETVSAELRGDRVFVSSAELEAWQPRAF